MVDIVLSFNNVFVIMRLHVDIRDKGCTCKYCSFRGRVKNSSHVSYYTWRAILHLSIFHRSVKMLAIEIFF